MCIERGSRHQTGVTLIELVMFIVIISVAVVGILSVMTLTTRQSADPVIRKQVVAIAESLMEEIQLQPFTWCDPEDDNAATVASAAACTVAQGVGPTAGQTRYADPRYNNVGDYHGFSMTGIKALEDGSAITPLNSYNAAVTVTQDAQNGVAAADSLRIDVTVTGPNNETVTLTGYRFRYAPRSVP